MAHEDACARRVARLRELMGARGHDAVVLRNNPDLRWLTGARGVFDDEVAHTALVTADGLWLHTDSRYYNSFMERLGEDSVWQLDKEVVTPADRRRPHPSGACARGGDRGHLRPRLL